MRLFKLLLMLLFIVSCSESGRPTLGGGDDGDDGGSGGFNLTACDNKFSNRVIEASFAFRALCDENNELKIVSDEVVTDYFKNINSILRPHKGSLCISDFNDATNTLTYLQVIRSNYSGERDNILTFEVGERCDLLKDFSPYAYISHNVEGEIQCEGLYKAIKLPENELSTLGTQALEAHQKYFPGLVLRKWGLPGKINDYQCETKNADFDYQLMYHSLDTEIVSRVVTIDTVENTKELIVDDVSTVTCVETVTLSDYEYECVINDLFVVTD